MRKIIIATKSVMNPEDLELLKINNCEIYENIAIEEIPNIFTDEDEKVIGLYWTGVYPQGKVNTDSLLRIKNLKGICLSTTGYGWIEIKTLIQHGITICNAPYKSTNSVAEFYFWGMISLLRKLPILIKDNWTNLDLIGRDATGLNVGIVGLGEIGNKFAQMCEGTNMKISYWNRSKKNSKYQYKGLKEIFVESDVIFISLAYTSDMKGFIDNELIDSMKRDAIILNCGEKQLFDKQYIIKKVEEEQLGGFFFETDNFEVGNRIIDYKGNILPMTEIGYFTKETLNNESARITESILGLANGKPVNVINP